MSWWGVVQQWIPGTWNQVNWPVSFESSVFFSYQQCFEERVFVGFESSVMSCDFIINQRFGETCRLHLQGRRNNVSEKNFRRFLTDWLQFGEHWMRTLGEGEVVLCCSSQTNDQFGRGRQSGRFKRLLPRGRSVVSGAPENKQLNT
jgi:hypothetical protein